MPHYVTLREALTSGKRFKYYKRYAGSDSHSDDPGNHRWRIAKPELEYPYFKCAECGEVLYFVFSENEPDKWILERSATMSKIKAKILAFVESQDSLTEPTEAYEQPVEFLEQDSTYKVAKTKAKESVGTWGPVTLPLVVGRRYKFRDGSNTGPIVEGLCVLWEDNRGTYGNAIFLQIPGEALNRSNTAWEQTNLRGGFGEPLALEQLNES